MEESSRVDKNGENYTKRSKDKKGAEGLGTGREKLKKAKEEKGNQLQQTKLLHRYSPCTLFHRVFSWE